MTRVVGTPLRVTEFSSPSDEAVSARVSGDSVARVRIDAGGRLTWSDGSIAGDTKLYRTSASALGTEGVFTASLGLITNALDGPPNTSMPDGAILVDRSTNALYFRANNQWVAAGTGTGSGNASLTISDTPPASPEAGDLWFESDTGKVFVYYDSFWIETGGGGATGLATDLSELGDVALSTLLDGDVLRYNSSASVWTNDPINLGSDTSGNYVATIIGTANQVTVTDAGAESASVTISLPQSIATSSSVQFASVSAVATPGTTSTTSEYIGYIGIPQNSKSTNYELVAGDQGKHVYVTSTATVTIPANSSVAFPIGSVITIIAGAGATATIAITSDTMNLAGTGTTGSRTLAPYGVATLIKVASTTWFINGTGLT